MLQDERWIVSSEILGRFQSNMMKNKGTDDAVHGTDAELVHVLSAKTFRNPK